MTAIQLRITVVGGGLSNSERRLDFATPLPTMIVEGLANRV